MSTPAPQTKESHYVAFEGAAVNGPGMAWGVKQDGTTLYEPMFFQATSVRLAQLCETHGDNEWATQSALLKAEDFDLDDQSSVSTDQIQSLCRAGNANS